MISLFTLPRSAGLFNHPTRPNPSQSIPHFPIAGPLFLVKKRELSPFLAKTTGLNLATPQYAIIIIIIIITGGSVFSFFPFIISQIVIAPASTSYYYSSLWESLRLSFWSLPFITSSLETHPDRFWGESNATLSRTVHHTITYSTDIATKPKLDNTPSVFKP